VKVGIMAITQLTSVSSYISTIYEDAVFVAREVNLLANLVTPFGASGWMARTVPKWAQASAASVNDAQDYNNPTTMSKSTQATLTPGAIISQSLLTDQMVETDPDGAARAATQELGGAIATKIDTDLTSDFSSFDAEKGPGTGTAINFSYLAAANAVIMNAAKSFAPIFCVLHPYQWHDIWVELGRPTSTYSFLGEVANQALKDYAVSNMIGMQWFTSSNVTVSGSDAVGGVFRRDALALDTRRAMRLETERDASRRSTELNMTAGYAHGTLWSDRGRYITSDITEPTGA